MQSMAISKKTKNETGKKKETKPTISKRLGAGVLGNAPEQIRSPREKEESVDVL